MVSIKNVTYGKYGNCLEITNGVVVLKVTTDLGPRIIYYGTQDDNMMFNDTCDNVNRTNAYFDENFGEGVTWHIYGGHRLWKSPEDEASYFPDNDKVEVEMLENGAKFSSAYESTTGIRKSITITMDDDGIVYLDHEFYNFTDDVKKYAMWALSVMNKGGTAISPFTKVDTGLLANRNLVFWPYTNICDDRLKITNDYVSLTQKSVCDGPLKIGTLNTLGEVYFLRGDKLLVKNFEPAKFDGNYVDYSCNVEFYTSEHIIEVETLSEYMDIAPKTSVHHRETWRLHIADEIFDKIANKIK